MTCNLHNFYPLVFSKWNHAFNVYEAKNELMSAWNNAAQWRNNLSFEQKSNLPLVVRKGSSVINKFIYNLYKYYVFFIFRILAMH
jgi:hypothetical protein